MTEQANRSVESSLNDPDSQQELVGEFQGSDSDVLASTDTVQAQGAKTDDGDNRPTTVAIVFGCLLVALGAAGLITYAYVFIKKRRKKALKCRREREGQYDYNANTTLSTTSVNHSRSSPSGGKEGSPPPKVAMTVQSEEYEEEDSSASYDGVATESSGSKSDFTRELELAASLDRRAWNDFQRKWQVSFAKLFHSKRARLNYHSYRFTVSRLWSKRACFWGIDTVSGSVQNEIGRGGRRSG